MTQAHGTVGPPYDPVPLCITADINFRGVCVVGGGDSFVRRGMGVSMHEALTMSHILPKRCTDNINRGWRRIASRSRPTAYKQKPVEQANRRILLS